MSRRLEVTASEDCLGQIVNLIAEDGGSIHVVAVSAPMPRYLTIRVSITDAGYGRLVDIIAIDGGSTMDLGSPRLELLEGGDVG